MLNIVRIYQDAIVVAEQPNEHVEGLKIKILKIDN